MEGMTFLGFVLIVVVGFSLLALTLELLNPERQRVSLEQEKRVPETAVATGAVLAEPAFFSVRRTDQLPLTTPGFDDALLALLQNHVSTERAMASEFVHFPSVDTLYRQARPSLMLH